MTNPHEKAEQETVTHPEFHLWNFVKGCNREEAFEHLVVRFNKLIYSSALRRSGNPALAEDVAQSVLTILARKAPSLLRHPNLTAWVFQTTKLETMKAIRNETRRHKKHEKLQKDALLETVANLDTTESETWQRALPHLDDSLDRLSNRDRTLILKRFFEKQKFKDIALSLETTEGACKMQLKRALERLRFHLSEKSSLSVTALAAGLLTTLANTSPAKAASLLANHALSQSSALNLSTFLGYTLSTMKSLHFIPPVIALIGSATWIYSQEKPLRNLEESNLAIRERMAKEGTLQEKPTGSEQRITAGGRKTNGEKHLFPNGSFNWPVIGEMIKNYESGGNMGMSSDLRLLMQIKEQIMEMSAEELNAELAKLPGLELEEEIRKRLKIVLIESLAKNDPEVSFKMLEDDLPKQTSQGWWKLKRSFRDWSTMDPAAAAAWLDKMIVSGKFQDNSLDPKQSSRFDLETELMAVMVANDPKAIADRLSKFTPEERVAILQQTNVWSQRNGEIPEEFFSLVRAAVTGDDKDRIIGTALATTSFEGGLGKASAELEKRDLSDGERSEFIEAAVLKLSYNLGSGRGEFEDIYPWLQKEDPERAVELTGEILAWLGHRGDQLEMNFERALQVSEEYSDPQVVETMMENLAEGDENLRPKIEAFKDEALRKQFETLYQEATKSGESE